MPFLARPARKARTVCGAQPTAVARGLKLRHDHGSQYMSDHFQKEIAFRDIESSPALVRAPEGNGCVEQFIHKAEFGAPESSEDLHSNVVAGDEPAAGFSTVPPTRDIARTPSRNRKQLGRARCSIQVGLDISELRTLLANRFGEVLQRIRCLSRF
jgi:transposase InsO family protein